MRPLFHATPTISVYRKAFGMASWLWNKKSIRRALLPYNISAMDIDPRRYSDKREIPKYTIAEVSLYLGLKPRTLHTWFFGRKYIAHGKPVVWPPVLVPAAHNPKGPALSFYNLAEAHVLSATRDFDIKMKSIRSAMDTLKRLFPSEHPLISHDFETEGKDLFIRYLKGERDEEIINLSLGGLLGFRPVLDLYLKRIDRDARGLPVRVYPARDIRAESKRIVIIPSVAAGRPTIAGTGVRAEAVWNRALAGESPQDLAVDYGIEQLAIQEAISYFTIIKAA